MVCHTAILLKDDMAQVSDLQNSLAKNQTVLKNRACGYDEIRKFCHIDKLPSPLANPEDVDILEQNIRELSPYLLKILLQDKTTGRYIRWACDEYAKYGEAYTAEKEIFPELITGPNTKIIQPRIAKSKEDQLNRTRKSAEVFTPSWICAEMNNLCDEEWFGEPNVFNQVINKTWEPTLNKISFKETNKRKKAEWQRYVDSKRLEITCGEAPFLVSRYDTTTGEVLPIIKRIGLLDRKLRIVNENTDNEADWFVWAKRAYESTYGYEYQGDNLLLARENLLWSFIDNYKYKFQQFPTIAHLKQIANVIAWNIWQMDGLKECAPFVASEASQLELFNDLPTLSFPIICRVKDWRNKLVFYFRDLKGDKKMKFDYVIGNPPYQESRDDTKDIPVYHNFMSAAYEVANHVELITPARFLFNAGATPQKWNEMMLTDKHLKVLYYNQKSNEVFPGTDIKGGIAITYRDIFKNFGAIEVFTSHPELNAIRSKIGQTKSLSEIMVLQLKFNLNELYNDYPDLVRCIGSDGKERRLTSNIFERVPLFLNEKISDEDITIVGLEKNKRVIKYFPKKYIDLSHKNLFKYKVLIPKSNGSGEIGETLSTPIIGEPLQGYTFSFIGIGAFDTYKEAENVMKYIKSKFARTALGILKITQDNLPEKWKYVPLQDFTENSDIDWSKPIPEIDAQLYQKYGLTKDEIQFIETNVKPME